MKEHVGYLDGWRGAAISCVLLSHFAGIQDPLMGRLGVDLFFVLSGLLMSRILFEERTPLGTFYRRRISRILPVFLLYLVTIFGVYAALGQVVDTTEALASLTFTRTYIGGRIWRSEFPIGHLWSLNVEEHSYILLSLIAAIPLMRTAKGWLLIGVAGCLWIVTRWYWTHPDFAGPDYMIQTECAALPLVLSAGYRQVRHHFVRWVRPWMAPLAFVLAGFCYWSALPTFLHPFFAPFLLAFAVNHIGEAWDWVRQALDFRPLRYVGIWSFSIYLWQQPLYAFVRERTLPPLAGLALSLGIGLLSYYAWESPIRRRLNEYWGAAASPRVADTIDLGGGGR